MLSKPDQNGVTAREHLEQVERQTGRRPRELEGPEFPDLVSYLWSAFLSLSSCRGSTQYGGAPLTATDIKDWQSVSGQYLSARDFEAIKRLDALYLKVFMPSKSK